MECLEFWPVIDLPPKSGRYLVSAFGIIIIADYDEKKKYFTTGSGMDCDEIHVSAWAYIPEPVIYMSREIGEGDFTACSRQWFEKCSEDPLMDTKIIELYKIQ